MKTGQQLQVLRQKANMTQNELAERLFVSRDLIAKWEAGTRRPDHNAICALADIFGVTEQDILPAEDRLIRELSDCIPNDRDTDSEQLKNILNDFLRSLSAREAAVFVRRYYYTEAPSEIADFFAVKTQNVYLILSRVRKKLKKYLSEVLQ